RPPRKPDPRRAAILRSVSPAVRTRRPLPSRAPHPVSPLQRDRVRRQSIVDHVGVCAKSHSRPNWEEGSDGQGSEYGAGRARDPSANTPAVLRRGEGPHRPGGTAGRGERGGAVSARGPGAESVLPLEEGVPRGGEETAAGGHDAGGGGAPGAGAGRR